MDSNTVINLKFSIEGKCETDCSEEAALDIILTVISEKVTRCNDEVRFEIAKSLYFGMKPMSSAKVWDIKDGKKVLVNCFSFSSSGVFMLGSYPSEAIHQLESFPLKVERIGEGCHYKMRAHITTEIRESSLEEAIMANIRCPDSNTTLDRVRSAWTAPSTQRKSKKSSKAV